MIRVRGSTKNDEVEKEYDQEGGRYWKGKRDVLGFEKQQILQSLKVDRFWNKLDKETFECLKLDME